MADSLQRRRCNRPILVTGSSRSGTTWVGKMIASHPRVVYIQEPFNPRHRHPGSPVQYYYEHVTDQTAEAFRAYLDGLMRFPTNWWADICARPTPRRLVGASLRLLNSWRRRLVGCRPLLKDPIALFSAPWIAKTYDADVIVLIRHPAAYVASVKRLNMRFGFGHLVLQPMLLERYLQPLAREIQACHERQCRGPIDIIDEAILAWRVVHHVIAVYQREHPEWCFARHEDLSRAPLPGFRRLFDHLGLPWTAQVEQMIAIHSSEDNPKATAANVSHQLKLDSKANVWSWSNRLTADEIARIRAGAEDVAHHFYTDAEWQYNNSASAA